MTGRTLGDLLRCNLGESKEFGEFDGYSFQARHLSIPIDSKHQSIDEGGEQEEVRREVGNDLREGLEVAIRVNLDPKVIGEHLALREDRLEQPLVRASWLRNWKRKLLRG